jgi:hypothetical protein
LAKKYGLSTKKREKTAMYIEDLADYLQTNLTKQRNSSHTAGNAYSSPSSASSLDFLGTAP